MDWTKLLSPNRRRKSIRDPEEARAEFQRDYDRALFSAAVRRLQDKAQVHPLERNDSVRTRLTHSHEVANVARGLSDLALSHLRLGDNVRLAVSSIAATVGLLHDLGNPPFGHAGEQAIQSWFARGTGATALEPLVSHVAADQLKSDFKRFEGNAQTMRLVCRLQLLLDQDGLNLTFGTLSALRKYVAPSHRTNKENAGWKKPGFFFSESDRVTEIERETGCVGVRNPITVLVEAADDIVYSTVDLEDGITKGYITWSRFGELISNKCGGEAVIPRVLQSVEDDAKASEFFTRLTESHRDSVRSQLFRTKMIGQFVREAAAAYQEHSSAILEGQFSQSLLDVIPSRPVLKAMKGIEFAEIYRAKPVLKLEILGRHVIHDLMTLFWEAVQIATPEGPTDDYQRRIWDLLSPSYRLVFSDAYARAGSDVALQQYARLQLVCDNVCGMTDTFACDLHKELYGA
jgi:dGTPase